MNKTTATKAMRQLTRFGYFAVGTMEAKVKCDVCDQYVQGYLPKYAGTYASGFTYKDAMVTHMMEEH